MKTSNKNYCSAVVEFKDNDQEIRRVSLCTFNEAIRYINDVVFANNWTLVSMKRGFNY